MYLRALLLCRMVARSLIGGIVMNSQSDCLPLPSYAGAVYPLTSTPPVSVASSVAQQGMEDQGPACCFEPVAHAKACRSYRAYRGSRAYGSCPRHAGRHAAAGHRSRVGRDRRSLCRCLRGWYFLIPFMVTVGGGSKGPRRDTWHHPRSNADSNNHGEFARVIPCSGGGLLASSADGRSPANERSHEKHSSNNIRMCVEVYR